MDVDGFLPVDHCQDGSDSQQITSKYMEAHGRYKIISTRWDVTAFKPYVSLCLVSNGHMDFRVDTIRMGGS